ncbi:MAG TPA: DUF4126 domain-containing protein [Anaerolineae bacterium]|nr:DUF4126 domain-containing protein [Anaerolineae bacterium]HPL29809.1 DUF4126 domain-containing protein [Anaerolineae bacterium]
MIQAITGLATAFGLSSSAGLNAYLPLLIVALTARFTPLIRLNPPFDALSSPWVIGVLVVLLTIEIVADKVPAVDTVNDAIQTFIRPAAGAILFAATTNAIADIHPVLAMVCGVILAGGVHAVKATARPAITATTAGVANPIVSTAEDVVSAVTSLISLLAPLLAVLVVLSLIVVALLLWSRRRRALRET